MTLKEIALSLDRTNKNLQDNINWMNWFEFFGFYGENWPENEETLPLKCYWIQPWYCTDSWVGARAYFLHDELVCVSIQQGRKCDEEYSFVSKEAGMKVKSLIESIRRPEDEFEFNILKDIEESDEYFLDHASCFIPKFHKFGRHVTLNEIVEITWASRDYKDFHGITIKRQNGEEIYDDIRNIRFKYGRAFE